MTAPKSEGTPRKPARTQNSSRNPFLEALQHGAGDSYDSGKDAPLNAGLAERASLEARQLLGRFCKSKAGAWADWKPGRQPTIDPYGVEAQRVEFAAQTQRGAGKLASWIRRAEARGGYVRVPNPAAGDGACVLFLDGRAMAELTERLAIYDELTAEALRLRQMRGER